MKKNLLFLLSLFLCFNVSFGQLYQGPANGSVPNGVIVSTNDFKDISYEIPITPLVKRKLRNNIPIVPYPDYLNTTPPSAPEGSNYIIDPMFVNGYRFNNTEPLLVYSFKGLSDPGNYIPPDPYIAVGPTRNRC